MGKANAILLIVIAMAAAHGGAAAGAAPAKLWEVSGLERPESALPDRADGIAYVSSMGGEPTAKDGDGFISKISLDGKMVALRWATGLDAPKGMALVRDRLYVADIDKLVAIDTGTGKIAATYAAKDAKFLNDVAADGEGRVYVSDMGANTLWRLADGRFEPWLEDAVLDAPNGLAVRGGALIVASFGMTGEDGKTRAPGRLLEVSIENKSVRDLGAGGARGNLDGLVDLGGGALLVSDWVAGAVYRVDGAGKSELLLDLNQGSADIDAIPGERLLLVPMMLDDLVAAYRLE